MLRVFPKPQSCYTRSFSPTRPGIFMRYNQTMWEQLKSFLEYIANPGREFGPMLFLLGIEIGVLIFLAVLYLVR